MGVRLLLTPSTSRKARQRGMQEASVLAIAINNNGEIDEVKTVRRLDRDLDQAAVNTIKRWRFAPAENDGEAVPFQTLVEVCFRVHCLRT